MAPTSRRAGSRNWSADPVSDRGGWCGRCSSGSRSRAARHRVATAGRGRGRSTGRSPRPRCPAAPSRRRLGRWRVDDDAHGVVEARATRRPAERQRHRHRHDVRDVALRGRRADRPARDPAPHGDPARLDELVVLGREAPIEIVDERPTGWRPRHVDGRALVGCRHVRWAAPGGDVACRAVGVGGGGVEHGALADRAPHVRLAGRPPVGDDLDREVDLFAGDGVGDVLGGDPDQGTTRDGFGGGDAGRQAGPAVEEPERRAQPLDHRQRGVGGVRLQPQPEELDIGSSTRQRHGQILPCRATHHYGRWACGWP